VIHLSVTRPCPCAGVLRSVSVIFICACLQETYFWLAFLCSSLHSCFNCYLLPFPVLSDFRIKFHSLPCKFLGTYLPSVLWCCWLAHLTHNNPPPIFPMMCSVGRQTLLDFNLVKIPASHNLYFKQFARIMYTVCAGCTLHETETRSDICQAVYCSVLTSAGMDSGMLVPFPHSNSVLLRNYPMSMPIYAGFQWKNYKRNSQGRPCLLSPISCSISDLFEA